jgi:DNA-binding NarL/FixJ family response regulator
MARPGGYASKAEQVQRAEKIKALYAEGVSLTNIATRLHISPSTATDLATKLGLRRSVDRGARKEEA